MVQNMKVNTFRVRNTVKGNILGLMEVIMMVRGFII